MPRLVICAALVLTVGVACRYQPTPVPLRGAAVDIGKLAGTWVGSYSSA